MKNHIVEKMIGVFCISILAGLLVFPMGPFDTVKAEFKSVDIDRYPLVSDFLGFRESSDTLNIDISDFTQEVLVTEIEKDVFINDSQEITITIYGETTESTMNASISITGCGMELYVDENEAIDQGKYVIQISPKIAGTLTFTATNKTHGLTKSRDYTITGLTGTMTTSLDDDLVYILGATETIIVSITNGQYSDVCLTWFDKNWEHGTLINKTLGDATQGAGQNGVFTFELTEKDLPMDSGYIVVTAEAGIDNFCYDIIEISTPTLNTLLMIGTIDDLHVMNETSTFHANNLMTIDSSLSVSMYRSNEKFIIYQNHPGIVTKSFIIGLVQGKML